MSYSTWDRKKSDITEQLSTHTHTHTEKEYSLNKKQRAGGISEKQEIF